MQLFIINSKGYTHPAKEVFLNGFSIGHVHPMGNALIYSAGDKFDSIKAIFEYNDEALIEAINLIKEYCKENQYDSIYIDNYLYGIAPLREVAFWMNIGFLADQNPDILYMRCIN